MSISRTSSRIIKEHCFSSWMIQLGKALNAFVFFSGVWCRRFKSNVMSKTYELHSTYIYIYIQSWGLKNLQAKDVQHGAAYCLDLTSHCNKLLFKENNAIHAYSCKDHLKDLQDPKIPRVAERPTRSRRRALQRHVLKEQTLRGLAWTPVEGKYIYISIYLYTHIPGLIYIYI